MLDKIFGTVKANKIRVLIQKYKILRAIELFCIRYVDTFKKSDEKWKFYLCIAPVLNIFIFSGLFAFIVVMISNFVIFIKVNNK